MEKPETLKYGDTSAWSASFKFYTVDTLNNPPNLYLPANGATEDAKCSFGMAGTIIGGKNDTITYNVKIDDNSSLKKPATLTKIKTNHVNADTLRFGTKYWWKVIVLNHGKAIDSSGVFYFTVINKPTLISPFNDTIN